MAGKYSLDVKIERELKARGVDDVSVKDSVVRAGWFVERINGVCGPVRLDTLANRIKAATAGGAG
jgi:Ni,Fe-hydrogenase III large subunit